MIEHSFLQQYILAHLEIFETLWWILWWVVLAKLAHRVVRRALSTEDV